ncbi:MAG: RNA 2',3'-cyclic phosphodiesterase [Planctomycetes bacterium]|nr:RNA 2',3'-cyclic phosphodiesterase [Planctomycetota bacterium]
MRCFIAIDIDEAARSRIEELAEQLQQEAQLGKSGIKWVATENIHLTLKFLGEVRDAEIAEVCRIVADTAGDHERFAVEAANVGSFGRPPRVVWVGINDSGDLAKLQKDLDGRLADAGWPTDQKQFHGHLTLCRVKNTHAGKVLGDVLRRREPVSVGTIFVDSLCVYSSDLTPAGAVYALVSRSSMK